MSYITTLSKLLLIIGGLNWGLIGFVHFDLIATFLGEMTAASRVFYASMGSAGVWLLSTMLCDAMLGPYESANTVY